MKLAIKYLSDIEGIGMTQSISFVFFFAIFLAIVYYVFKMKNSYYTSISEMPLKDEIDSYSDNEMIKEL
ncbi:MULTISPECIES: CcoQ/FixQ family Cbb3-type cytochrome c oxidase assembly chaperone [unclassified Lentimicrobium]|uniref:CcoQ/FixQ family Cbb3-type cytochrome c oxidase assembly chaperone n=1 Tax=unclassified Lentimicrobium TaxID=2677434 RepID=UPI0015528BD8|nr:MULTISPECIES: CcoQ/FixQ family Cbb3-type cytochrome c oxidase assembly chaperone [unclassified Lentimicrobium]NPD47636.1 cbb3-type cytochrome c oxidase subunit 3 [Lentimicrobium sp. S6]NPD86512.1 cbb3-type cytochrome c oxidase subunit 3 [Lentimicrobium sp. L6]